MKDELHDLLHRADASARSPEYDASNLATRVRRSSRNQRRLAACGFAILALSLSVIPAMLFRTNDKEQMAKAPTKTAQRDLDLDASIHERTADLLIANRRSRRSTAASDTFLADLQMQRHRAALLLLRDANRETTLSDPIRVATLKKTIELFPDTPAAAMARQQLQQTEPTKRQS